MKKSFIIIALSLAGTFFFQASANATTLDRQNIEMTISQSGDFVEITLEEVIPAVKNALENYLNEYEISLIEFNAAEELTRITLNPKSEEKEILILTFNGNGEII